MGTLSSILFSILIFSFLIFIHEFGHYFTAKLFDVQVNEFSMFMGPALWKKQIGETLYTIRCIPIGGYCAMEGEDTDTENPRSFQKAAWWKRCIILVAGAAMNFITAVVIVVIVLFNQPLYASTQLHAVDDWSLLGGEQGLQAGDTIVELNGEKIRIYEDFILVTTVLPDGNYDVVVERDGQLVTLEKVPMIRQLVQDADGNEKMLYGISFEIEQTTAESVPGRIWPTITSYVKSVIVSLQMLVKGQVGINEMDGPVGIVDQMTDIAASSPTTMAAIVNLLSIGGLIAVNLAVMNLLPIPALDGGRVVALLLTTGVKAVTKKEIDPKYEGYIHAAGMILLLALMAIIMFKDIIFIFKG